MNNNGRFLKGSVPWNKGKTAIYSKETLEKMSKSKLGKHMSSKTEFKKRHKTWNKNMKHLYIPGSEKGWFLEGNKFSKEIETRRLNTLRDRILIKPDLEFDENMGYILGLIKGDGCVYRNQRSFRISLESVDKQIADNLIRSLIKIGLNPFVGKIKPSNGISKLERYRVLANSKIFYEWYRNLSNKDLKIGLVTKRSMIGFVRGFYEAEGSLTKSRNSLVISIYNTNLDLLLLVKYFLEKLGISFRLNGPYKNNGLGGCSSKPIYRIITSSRGRVLSFLELIKPSVKNQVRSTLTAALPKTNSSANLSASIEIYLCRSRLNFSPARRSNIYLFVPTLHRRIPWPGCKISEGRTLRSQSSF